MALKRPRKAELLGLDPGELESFFPEEMTRLGVLTAYWSLVEDALCRTLASLLSDAPKAEAAFYSTTNHKARRDMVFAIAKNANLPTGTLELIEDAIGETKKAADARNNLLHGLFKVEFKTGKLVAERKRPITKVPTLTNKDVLKEADNAIEKFEIAEALLSQAAIVIQWPELPDDIWDTIRSFMDPRNKKPLQ